MIIFALNTGLQYVVHVCGYNRLSIFISLLKFCTNSLGRPTWDDQALNFIQKTEPKLWPHINSQDFLLAPRPEHFVEHTRAHFSGLQVTTINLGLKFTNPVWINKVANMKVSKSNEVKRANPSDTIQLTVALPGHGAIGKVRLRPAQDMVYAEKSSKTTPILQWQLVTEDLRNC